MGADGAKSVFGLCGGYLHGVAPALAIGHFSYWACIRQSGNSVLLGGPIMAGCL
jgi:hypothetical protein